jgi:hypothetical protein
MPVETRINIPFIPQEGITNQILQAITLANESHARQQQLGIQQQQVGVEQAGLPSLIAQRQAETEAIPQRLALSQKQLEAETELRRATLAAEQAFREGMMGIRKEHEQNEAMNNAGKLELAAQRNVWQQAKAEADVTTAQGRLQLGRLATANLAKYQQAEITLRQQANALREQGNETQAQNMMTRADQVANSAGFWRTALGEVGLMPEVQVPPGAQTKGTPKAPTQFHYDAQGNRVAGP